MAKATGKKRDGMSLIWLQGLACGAMAALAPASALQVGLLLAPVIGALFMDHRSGKPIARAMLLFALAACVEPVRQSWVAGQGLAVGLDRAVDIGNLIPAWAAAAGGWLLSQAVPVMVGAILDAGSRTRAAQLQAGRARLVAEWGLEETPAGQ
ncbi:MAG: hypothetical protein AB7O80_08105 [Acetobacteraceae bacterium]